MADRIKLLPDSVANQIAAGEVVNRPSSVVKELLENAVDAGAGNISVNFKDGGKTFIQIVDDGQGMSPTDARLAFDRYATSKIRGVEDIYNIGTFGFRGEALASIASVAEVELRTRRHDDELGTKVEICGGKFTDQSPVNCPVGSQFMIKNLFYNVPARRRFLDKSSTETRHILAEYQRVALCNPGIGFSLYDSDSLISKLPPSGLRQRIVGVIGKNIAKHLMEVSADTSIVKVEGFVGRPEGAKQNNKEQFLFVNGRYFKSPYFHKAVVSAYEKLIPANTQPSYFIYLEIDREQIDVNVHPQKTEVKFTNGSDIWQIINAAVRESLAKSGAIPQMDFELDTSIEIPVFRESVSYRAPEIKGNPDFNPFLKGDGTLPPGRSSKADLSDFMEGFNCDARTDSSSVNEIYGDGIGSAYGSSGEAEYESSILEFIEGEDAEQGRLDIGEAECRSEVLLVNQQYFAVSSGGNLIIVDIRRAYESVLYDRYLLMLGNGSSVSQQMLFTEKIAMSIDDISLLRECEADFIAFGFDFSFIDDHTVEISGLPADFTGTATEDLMYDLLDTLRDETGEASEIRRRRLAATMARVGSAAHSRVMNREELSALWEQLAASANPSYTPAGKTVLKALTSDDINKKFK